jgi:hypothetical protein
MISLHSMLMLSVSINMMEKGVIKKISLISGCIQYCGKELYMCVKYADKKNGTQLNWILNSIDMKVTTCMRSPISGSD